MASRYDNNNLYIISWDSGQISSKTRKPIRNSIQVKNLEKARTIAKEKKDCGYANVQILH